MHTWKKKKRKLFKNDGNSNHLNREIKELRRNRDGR